MSMYYDLGMFNLIHTSNQFYCVLFITVGLWLLYKKFWYSVSLPKIKYFRTSNQIVKNKTIKKKDISLLFHVTSRTDIHHASAQSNVVM